MGERMAIWYNEQGEYVLGGLFGLVTLDLFMFFVHCLTERTTSGYGLTSLFIASSFLAVAYFEKLYSQQEAH